MITQAARAGQAWAEAQHRLIQTVGLSKATLSDKCASEKQWDGKDAAG